MARKQYQPQATPSRVNDNGLVVKHNHLIEAHYSLGLQEQKLIAIMCSQISPDDEDFKTYSFLVKDLGAILGLVNPYPDIRSIARNLMRKVMTIRIPAQNQILEVAWLSSARYYSGEGRIDFRFDPALKPYLLQLKACFTKYRLLDFLTLRSKYACRLYEICKKYERLTRFRYSLDALREILDIKGSLVRWFDFQRRCLEPAVREINAKTDLHVSYILEKAGRMVTGLTFTVQPRTDRPELPDEQLKPYFEAMEDQQRQEELERVNKLIKLVKPLDAVEKRKVEKLLSVALNKYGYDRCRRNILYANNSARKSYAAFLAMALRDDWGEDVEEEQKYKAACEELSEKIKNARIVMNGREYEADGSGNVMREDGMVLAGQVIQAILRGMAQVQDDSSGS